MQSAIEDYYLKSLWIQLLWASYVIFIYIASEIRGWRVYS